jgi:hypothetical protein
VAEDDKKDEPEKGATSPPKDGGKQPAAVVEVPLDLDIVVKIILIPFASVKTPSSDVLNEVNQRCDQIRDKFLDEGRKFAEKKKAVLRQITFDVSTKPKSQAGKKFGPLEFPVFMVTVDPKSSSRVALGDVNDLVSAQGLAPFTNADLSPGTHAAGFTRTQLPRKICFVKHDVLTDQDDHRGTPQKRLTYAIVHEVVHAAGVGEKVAGHFAVDEKYFPLRDSHDPKKGRDMWHDPSGLLSQDLIRETGAFVLPEDDRGSDFITNLVNMAIYEKKHEKKP